ncbi:MAG: 3-hydroxyacyl-[acyl-carrier-protein] dehydratase FabZ [Gammaproteobacteria bacterium]|nr:3-hydroxyacyl-[acyl-carrier-protein] dehydratase FabZ [Gammaproteobacteria bacterium]
MTKIIDIEKIIKMMPHRYPFLLIDRLIDIKNDEYAIGLKNVTINEPFFLGHFPGKKVMPGVLIVESMAQTSGALVVSSYGDKAMGKLVYFMSIDKARFRKLVTPGDQLYIEVKKKQARKLVWKFDCIARVDHKIVAEATITAMIVDDNDK